MPRALHRAPRLIALTALAALAACGGRPDLDAFYRPYREAAVWTYRTDFSGQGRTSEGRLELRTRPRDAKGDTVDVDVKLIILPEPGSAGGGSTQHYTLDLSGATPRLAALRTDGGRADLQPGLPFPDFQAADGRGRAAYDAGKGRLAGRSYGFRWKYVPEPSGALTTPAGRFDVNRVDLEYRGDVPLTASNIRLEFAAGAGLVRAEWKTSYGTTTTFTLLEHERGGK